ARGAAAQTSMCRGPSPTGYEGRTQRRPADPAGRPHHCQELVIVDATPVVVTGAGGSRCVTPVALDLPHTSVRERRVRVEVPRALVSVLRALPVVPRVEMRVCLRLAELVTADVGKRGEPL